MDNTNGDNTMIKRMTWRQGLLCLILLVLLGVIAAVTLQAEERQRLSEIQQGQLLLNFSHDSGIYEEGLQLQLTAGGAEDIYYTLDGTQPVLSDDSINHYDAGQGIVLECGEREQVYTVKAVGYAGEEACTPVYTKTYIIGSGALERYQTPVLCVTGDPADLLDPGSGIFQGENKELRGRENEKAVHVSLLDEGKEVLNQNAGLRIYGGGSRQKNQPSFRLYARSEYDEQNWFEYLFFQDSYNVDNSLTRKYKRVIVRNSGDDNGFAYLRNELSLRLAREAGFQDTQCASPVCVYINGEYYGVYWFVTNYDAWYFENKYGAYDGEMVVLSGAVHRVDYPEEGEENEAACRIWEEYSQLHASLAYADLNDDTNWKLLKEAVDVENFIQYAAIENYICNWDSLQNNFKTYRYDSPDGSYQEGTVFDGRYRFLLYDLDESLNNYGPEDIVRSDVNVLQTTERMNSYSEHNALFRNIMFRPEGREYYIRYYLSLLNYYFAEEKSVPAMEEMHRSHDRELRYLYNQTDLLEGNMGGMPEDADYDHALSELERIRQFLCDRPAVALEDLSAAFEISQTYELQIFNEQQANISVDFASFHDKEYRGTYFGEIPVVLTAASRPGYRFDHWLINGDVIQEETVTLLGDWVVDGIIAIECVLYPEETAELMITAAKYKGTNDCVEVTNFGQESVSLSDYLLADRKDEEKTVRLPAVLVGPGESILLYCKNYTGAEALGRPGLGFNLKDGETLCLYRRKNSELIQAITLPELGSEEGVYRMDWYSGEFREETGQRDT